MNYSFLKTNKLIRFVVVIALGLICLTYVIFSFNWTQIWQTLQTAHLASFFSGAVATLIVYFFVRTLRWRLLLGDENLPIPFFRLYLHNSVSIGFSTITPFQSGEALKVELMRKYGGERFSGYTIFFIERILDFSTVVGLGILGTYYGFNFGIPQSYFYLTAAFLVVGFSALLTMVFVFPSEKLSPLKIILRDKWKRKQALVGASILTLIAWLIIIMGWKLTLASVSINIDLPQSMSLVSLIALLATFSFVPGAVGVSEIGVAAVLTKMGVAPALAQTGAVAIRAYALMILLLTLIHWLLLKILPDSHLQESTK